jgi:hypothetical protein
MALLIRKLSDDATFALVEAHNLQQRDIATIRLLPHADITSKAQGGSFDDPNNQAPDLVTAPDGSGTLAPLLVLCADIKRVYEKHLADDLAHKLADPAPALVAATDLPTAQTLLNAIKADYNTHRASTTYHYAADATNATTAADATNQASADTLANELKADLNAHLQAAPLAPSIKFIGV